MMKKKLYLVFVFVLSFGLVQSIQAQDIHYSQFYMAPTILNPAMTGVMDCNVRFSGNYRNQWSPVIGNAAYNTYSAAYDQKFTVGQYDYWGIGVNLTGDVAGTSNFTTYQGNLAGSFSKYLGGGRNSSHYLVFGAEVGLGSRSIAYQNLRFGTQHDGQGGFDPDLSNLENFPNESFIYPDLNAGLLYFTTWKNSSFYIGGAYHHINKPNVTFDENTSVPMYSKFTFHSGGEFALGDGNTSLVPGIVTFFQGPSWQLNLGTALRWYIGNQRYNKQSFQIGLWTRLVNNYVGPVIDTNEISPPTYELGADAIILSTRFEYNQFSIGFSYDMNVSKLRENSPGNGSFEFSIMYFICGPERRGVYCPSF